MAAHRRHRPNNQLPKGLHCHAKLTFESAATIAAKAAAATVARVEESQGVAVAENDIELFIQMIENF